QLVGLLIHLSFGSHSLGLANSLWKVSRKVLPPLFICPKPFHARPCSVGGVVQRAFGQNYRRLIAHSCSCTSTRDSVPLATQNLRAQHLMWDGKDERSLKRGQLSQLQENQSADATDPSIRYTPVKQLNVIFSPSRDGKKRV
ncbi:unnamed protein product, partial [Ectocarpus sp. 12 AP-2014]